MAEKYDVIIIGAGSGSKLARPIAKLGFKVAYIERGKLGGTCLNHGCIPSKMLLEPCFKLEEIVDEASKFNISIKDGKNKGFNALIDKKALVERVCGEIDEDSASILPLLQNQSGLTVFLGTARFVGYKVLRVESNDGQTEAEIFADKIYIAAGCSASIPKEKAGLEKTPLLTYKEVLRLETVPNSVIVIGGGYVATELGYMLSKTGSHVEFLVRNRMLGGEDGDIQTRFEEIFASKHNVTFNAHAKRVSFDEMRKEFTLIVSISGKVVERKCDCLFIATGVASNATLLDVEKTGVHLEENGFIKVDEYLQTAVEGIYAFGDVTGRALFKHAANYEGEYLFNSHYKTDLVESRPISYPPMPHAVFSSPQIAGVGLTSEQAQVVYGGGQGIVTGTSDYSDVAMGNAMLDETGFCKLIFARLSRVLVGAHFLGKEASTLVHMCIAFMKFKATVEDMDDCIYIHPSLAEVIRAAVRHAKSQFQHGNDS